MTPKTVTINLKDNLYISLDGTTPKNAKKMIMGSLSFMSEDESKWYVQTIGVRFKNYLSKSNQTMMSAKNSLRSAIESLVIKGMDPEKVKFSIYSIN